jgi:hypothetical protein
LLLLLVQDAGMRLVEELAEQEDIIIAKVLPLISIVALLLALARCNTEPWGSVALVAPNGDFDRAVAKLLRGFAHLAYSIPWD